jgi:hypothetical protein
MSFVIVLLTLGHSKIDSLLPNKSSSMNVCSTHLHHIFVCYHKMLCVRTSQTYYMLTNINDDSTIIHDPVFERAIVKLQGGCEKDLTATEKRQIRRFEKLGIDNRVCAKDFFAFNFRLVSAKSSAKFCTRSVFFQRVQNEFCTQFKMTISTS